MIDKGCTICKYSERAYSRFPCTKCYAFDKFEPISEEQQEQLQEDVDCDNCKYIPQEEINHPDRYASNKYECIDIMIDVFGVEATKQFCKLNAFKYIWREEHKNGIEDIKKARWYLDKLIEIEEETDND